MKKFVIFLASVLLSSCATKQKIETVKAEPEIKEPVRIEEKKPEEKKVPEVSITTGWQDADTYIVRVTGMDEDRAKEAARHKILKDIVNVRVRNMSPYTDITKISNEFKKPLEQGVIIRKREIEEGLEIYFQIKDRGLRKKFERK